MFCSNCGKKTEECACGPNRSRSPRGGGTPDVPGLPFDLSAFASALKPYMKEACEEAVGIRISALEDRVTVVESHGPRITALENQVLKLSTHQSSSSEEVGSNFVPKYIELKGFCEFEQRHEKGISHKEAERFFLAIREHMPEQVRPKMKAEVRLGGLLGYKIKVFVEAGHAQEVKGCVEDIVTTHGMKINGVIPRVVTERSPTMQDKYNKFGKLCDCLKKAAKGRENITERVEARFCGCFVDVVGRDRPVFIGEVRGDPAGIEVCENNIRDIFGIDAEAFLALGDRR